MVLTWPGNTTLRWRFKLAPNGALWYLILSGNETQLISFKLAPNGALWYSMLSNMIQKSVLNSSYFSQIGFFAAYQTKIKGANSRFFRRTSSPKSKIC